MGAGGFFRLNEAIFNVPEDDALDSQLSGRHLVGTLWDVWFIDVHWFAGASMVLVSC